MTVKTTKVRDEERAALIRQAAFGQFSSYGFKKTSMDDIAKAAGISRPALYQTFVNKNDIFRALIEDALEESVIKAGDCIARGLPLRERLDGLLDIMVLDHHRMMHAMPHGEEILGLKREIAQDLFDKWEQKNREIFKQAFAAEPGLENALDMPLAQTIALAISGMKARNLPPEDMQHELQSVIDVVMLASGGGK